MTGEETGHARHNAPGAWRPYEPGGRLRRTDLYYLAGQVGTPGTPVEEQTAVALAEVNRLLAVCGSDKSRILSATIWLADMADFAAMNAVWEKCVDPDNPSALATGEARLATPDYRFEVIVVAAK